MTVRLHCGDCLDVMAGMDATSIDAIVTDPPYGLAFMGKAWDHGVPGEPFWREALRVAKPGAHLVAFGGTRTHHRLMVAIEDAGWEIRDCLMWLYGSGFPKSLDVSKAIDKAAGAERPVVGIAKGAGSSNTHSLGEYRSEYSATAAVTDAARQWAGWGTALKPAVEPIILARKPLAGTVAQNVQTHGTGAINVDGCRIGAESTRRDTGRAALGVMNDDGWRARSVIGGSDSGRWPANLLLDGDSAALLDFATREIEAGAVRYFYTAKADADDRNDGCDRLDQWSAGDVTDRKDGTAGLNSPRAGAGRTSGNRNHHPTVKPTDLMRWLVRLVTPLGGTVLDPFMGSGSTGRGAVLEGCRFVGIELSPEYLAIAQARIEAAQRHQPLPFEDVGRVDDGPQQASLLSVEVA